MLKKLIALLGIIILGLGIYLYVIKEEEVVDERFLLLEIKANDTTVTIEPKKLLAYANGTEIKLTSNLMDSYIKYFNQYWDVIKDNKIKDNTDYLWTIKYKDSNLNNYLIGKDEYPIDWDVFIDKTNVLLKNQYLKKQVAIVSSQKMNNKVVTSINFKDTCNAYNCTYNIKINKEEKLLEFIREKAGNDKFGKQKIKIDGNLIVNEDFLCGGPIKLEVINDTFVILYQYGCNSEGYVLKGYNILGKQIFKYDNNIDNDYLGMYLNTDNFEVKNKKIIVNTSREMAGAEILIGKNNSISYCDSELMNNHQITSDFIVRATYEISYNNGSYSSPKMISSKTINDLKLLNNCKKEEE